MGALPGEGGTIRWNCAWEEQGSNIATGETRIIAMGSMEYCCLFLGGGGIGEHYYVRECCYEQSEAMRGVGLQAEQSEITKRMALWEKNAKINLLEHFLFFSYAIVEVLLIFLQGCKRRQWQATIVIFFFLMIIHKKTTSTMLVVIIFCFFFFLLCSRRRW
jgi:hypothetical protein